MTSFYGTDTISGCVLARNYYLATKIVGNSIPATEHSTMVSWTRERERDAYENLLGKDEFRFIKFFIYLLIDMYPTGVIGCVSDSYNIYNACEHIWGEELHDKVMARNGTLVIRPDSGKNILGVKNNN